MGSVAGRRRFSVTTAMERRIYGLFEKGNENHLLILFLGVLPMPSHASSIGNGSQTATIASVERHYFLQTTAGTNLGASAYQYVTNDGLTGPGYCIDHGLGYASKPLPITGKYTTSPSTAGAFANGYPQHSVETFLGLFLDENPILAGLTAVEFGYATHGRPSASLPLRGRSIPAAGRLWRSR